MRIVAVLAGLVLASSCSNADDRSAPVTLTVKREGEMRIGNLTQKTLEPGDSVKALCFALAPAGYPGPVVKVRSGPTVGYAIVEADGLDYFETSAAQLQKLLPDCGNTGLS